MRLPLVVILSIAPLVALAPAQAQTPGPSAPGYAFEILSTDRWLHARQRAAFTPWNEAGSQDWLHIDSITAGTEPGVRVLRISQNFPREATYVRLVHDSVGRVLDLEATYPAPAQLSGQMQEYMAAMERLTGRYVRPERPAGFGSLEVDALELIPTFHPPSLVAGAEWTDPVRIENTRGETRFALEGTRHSRLLRDTVVEGVRHWIVRDSAVVDLVDRWQEPERSLDTLVVKERRATGTITGSYLFDPATGFLRERADTTRLSGETALHYPDGRTFSVPATYERRRTWRRYEPLAATARREEAMAAFNSRRTGMLVLPRDSVETRLRRGDAALLDSVIGEWHRARDPGERMRLRELISYAPHDARRQDQLDSLALAAGDTASVLRTILSRTNPGRPLRVEDLELALPLLRDPAVALGYGLDPTFFYLGLAEAMLRYPPALGGDLPGIACTLAACRLLAAQVDAEGDPRLRDVALVAAFAMDPVRWEGTLRERAAEGSVLLEPAMGLLAGVGATWPAAARLPLPRDGAGWRDWLAWMAAPHPDLPPRPTTGSGPVANPLRFEQSHFVAIRFFEARTGESVTERIRRGYIEAQSDSARLVYGTMLLGLGEPLATPQQLADALADGSQADRTLALRQVRGLLRGAPPADEAAAIEVLDRILSIAIEGAEPWPQLAGTGDPSGRRSARKITAGGPILVLSDDLPAAVRERWAERAQLITRAEWEARSPRRAAVLFTPGRVLRSGPFVQASINYQTRAERGEDQSPSGFAGGFSVLLMQTDEGWIVVEESTWIT